MMIISMFNISHLLIAKHLWKQYFFLYVILNLQYMYWQIVMQCNRVCELQAPMVPHCDIRVWSESKLLENILLLVQVEKLVTFRSYYEISMSSCKTLSWFALPSLFFIHVHYGKGWCSSVLEIQVSVSCIYIDLEVE